MIVIKADRDHDLYLVWSGICDTWLNVGDRADTLDYLQRAKQPEAEQAIARADEKGSSDRQVKFAHWDDDVIPVTAEHPGDDACYLLERSKFLPYAQALNEDDHDRAYLLLTRDDDAEQG